MSSRIALLVMLVIAFIGFISVIVMAISMIRDKENRVEGAILLLAICAIIALGIIFVLEFSGYNIDWKEFMLS